LYLPELSLFSACVFGAGGLVAGLLGLVAGWRKVPGKTGPGLVPALLGLAGLGACSVATGKLPNLGWPALALAALLLLFAVARSDHLTHALASAWACARKPRWQWAALAVGCPVVALLAALLIPASLPQGVRPFEGIEPPPLRRLPPGAVVTDRGHDVPLWEAAGGPGPEEVLRTAEAETLRKYGLAGRVIQVAPGDRSYNCHGWTFTGGRYFLPDDAVEPILRDNGYRLVEQPELGDLVVYRNDHGAVCHTARVWAVQEDGPVLLESKWAWIGRYLHPPDATPFGSGWTYHRSARSGHYLRTPEGQPLTITQVAPSLSFPAHAR
jgi:hypothetical protein